MEKNWKWSRYQLCAYLLRTRMHEWHLWYFIWQRIYRPCVRICSIRKNKETSIKKCNKKRRQQFNINIEDNNIEIPEEYVKYFNKLLSMLILQKTHGIWIKITYNDATNNDIMDMQGQSKIINIEIK